MDTIMKADIFFFVTTISVVVVSAALLFGIYYIVGAVRRFESYAERIESNMKDASDEVRELGEDIRESFIYNFIFKKKKNARKSRD